jgi:flagellar basal body-associated protein FliL
MDPSEEKRKQKQPVAKKRSYVLPAVLLLILLCVIGGIYAFLNSSSPPPLAIPEPVTETTDTTTEPPTAKPTETLADTEEVLIPIPEEIVELDTTLSTPEVEKESTEGNIQKTPVQEDTVVQAEEIVIEEVVITQQPLEITTICSEPANQLDAFYTHLDKQPYVQAYKLQQSSEIHFRQLIEKLLANPPKVTRESDDLYTILRNTAHFFRISGKENILLLKGILNSEKDSLEQILADYYFLINTPECVHNKYAKNIDSDALYEYACFFLNTMGGRLYLFRRDSQSRMVVTYYAILLVDLANRQQNNRHGIALKPAIDMLISEMETGGSTMKGSEEYLDILYDLEETYQ